MTPLTHEQTSELLGPYTRAELDARAANQVRAHLETCPACRAEHEGFRRLTAAHSKADQSGELTADERARLRGGVMDAVARRRAAGAPGRPAASRREGRALRWLGAAAVLLVLGIVASSVGLTGGGGGAGSAGSVAGRHEPRALAPNGPAAPAERLGARFDRHAGRLSATDLPMLAAVPGPRAGADSGGTGGGAPAFGAAQGTSARPALGAREALLDRLAHAAPAGTAAQVTRCGRRVLARRALAVPLYGGLGRFEGREALVLGFVTAVHRRGPLNGYMFWVFEPGRCDRPLAQVSGALPR